MTLRQSLEDLQLAFANLEKAARADDKTPLKNTLALNETKESFTIGDHRSSVLIFADINRFKSVNTQYGYVAGDAAISFVGRLIYKHFVDDCEAQAFRAGGDEFVLLIGSGYLDKFEKRASFFKDCKVEFSGKVFTVSMSFGYAHFSENLAFDEILSRAETACKKAKLQGDGKISGWSDDLERDSLNSVRDTCSNCGTIISCEIPKKNTSQTINICPVCKNTI